MLKGRGASFTALQADYLGQMDRWLGAIAADTSSASRAEKVVRNKPRDLTDACWAEDGRKIAEPASYDGAGGRPNYANGVPIGEHGLINPWYQPRYR